MRQHVRLQTTTNVAIQSARFACDRCLPIALRETEVADRALVRTFA